MTETAPARTPREPATLSTLTAWRRAGLVLSAVGLVCLLGAVLATVADLDPAFLVAWLAALVLLLIGYGFLQRAWSDPLVAHDARVPLIRRVAGVASFGWGLALLVRLVALVLFDDADWTGWVALPFTVVGIAGYVAALVLAVRWRPGRV